MKVNPIVLTKDEADDFKASMPCIGSGVDGVVYKANKNDVFKFYKNNDLVRSRYVSYDDDGVNISDYKDLRHLRKESDIKPIKYIDEDGVLLSRKDAIYNAIDKQKKVTMTQLPKNIIYVGNKVSGCVYTYYPHSFGIYSCAYLPLKMKLKICRDILEKIKELLDNNIYPVTLAQRDELFSFTKRNSNILIGLDLEPKIIDLDGISAIYTDKFSLKYYNKTLTSLSFLLLEILTKVALDDKMLEKKEFKNYLEELTRKGIPELVAINFVENGYITVPQIEYTLKVLERKK